MKALRFFILSLLAAFSFAASAQTIEVYKDGRVIDSFSATQVDSVVYSPTAAQQRYYYYAGWDCPKTVEELERMAVEPYGGYWTSLENLDTNKNYYPNTITGPYDYWFFVVPNGINVYDYVSNSIMTGTTHRKVAEQPIEGYTIWKSTDSNKTDEFSGLKIY